MKTQFWQERWQEGKIGFHLPKVNPWLIKYLEEFNLTTNSRIFVPLCGKSEDLVYLAKSGFEVIGVELIQQAVEDFFTEQNLKPNLKTVDSFTQYSADNIHILHGDYFALNQNLIGKIDFVFDRASMVALPKPMRKNYIKKMKSIIGEAKNIFLITMEYPQNKLSGPPFSVPDSEIKAAYQEQFTIHLLETNDLSRENKFASLDYASEKIWKLNRQ